MDSQQTHGNTANARATACQLPRDARALPVNRCGNSLPARLHSVRLTFCASMPDETWLSTAERREASAAWAARRGRAQNRLSIASRVAGYSQVEDALLRPADPTACCVPARCAAHSITMSDSNTVPPLAGAVPSPYLQLSPDEVAAVSAGGPVVAALLLKANAACSTLEKAAVTARAECEAVLVEAETQFVALRAEIATLAADKQSHARTVATAGVFIAYGSVLCDVYASDFVLLHGVPRVCRVCCRYRGGKADGSAA